MNHLRTLILIALAAVLAACPPGGLAPPTTHTLTIYVDEQGTIDRTHHDPDPHLAWKDRLQWMVECRDANGAECELPKGTELDIENIHHVADLSQLSAAERDRVRAEADANRPVVPDYQGRQPNRPDRAFKNGLEPKDAGRKTVVKSTPYRGLEHEHLWKFTWVIKIDGQRVDDWDPHFSGGKRS